VPHRLHNITAPSSDHFQHVGQQTFMTTAHSQRSGDAEEAACTDGAETVTESAQTECASSQVMSSDGVAGAAGATFLALGSLDFLVTGLSE